MSRRSENVAAPLRALIPNTPTCGPLSRLGGPSTPRTSRAPARHNSQRNRPLGVKGPTSPTTATITKTATTKTRTTTPARAVLGRSLPSATAPFADFPAVCATVTATGPRVCRSREASGPLFFCFIYASVGAPLAPYYLFISTTAACIYVESHHCGTYIQS